MGGERLGIRPERGRRFTTRLQRLSTGLRINTGKDAPAGLIASENLRSDISSIKKAISNTDRANQVIATADGQYEFEGRPYRSLSMIAREITSSRWSGPVFFGLKDYAAKTSAKKGGSK